jgi:hypothetical protein
MLKAGRKQLFKAAKLLKRMNLFHGRYNMASLQETERARATPEYLEKMRLRYPMSIYTHRKSAEPKPDA